MPRYYIIIDCIPHAVPFIPRNYLSYTEKNYYFVTLSPFLLIYLSPTSLSSGNHQLVLCIFVFFWFCLFITLEFLNTKFEVQVGQMLVVSLANL